MGYQDQYHHHYLGGNDNEKMRLFEMKIKERDDLCCSNEKRYLIYIAKGVVVLILM